MKFLGGREKEDFKMMAEQNKYIDEAYQALIKLSADERKRLEYESRRKALYDYNTQMGAAERRGMEKGEEKGRNEGRTETLVNSILSFLSDYGIVSGEIKTRILEEKNTEILEKWLKTAARAHSIQDFIEKM